MLFEILSAHSSCQSFPNVFTYRQILKSLPVSVEHGSPGLDALRAQVIP